MLPLDASGSLANVPYRTLDTHDDMHPIRRHACLWTRQCVCTRAMCLQTRPSVKRRGVSPPNGGVVTGVLRWVPPLPPGELLQWQEDLDTTNREEYS